MARIPEMRELEWDGSIVNTAHAQSFRHDKSCVKDGARFTCNRTLERGGVGLNLKPGLGLHMREREEDAAQATPKAVALDLNPSHIAQQDERQQHARLGDQSHRHCLGCSLTECVEAG